MICQLLGGMYMGWWGGGAASWTCGPVHLCGVQGGGGHNRAAS
jgi:hypothetical protein